MEISIKDLRVKPGRIISQVNKGLDVTITCRGKPSAKIIPILTKETANINDMNDELFGIWKDRKDLENTDQINRHVRNMRKGRKL